MNTSVALIRHTKEGVKYTLLAERSGRLKSFASATIPKWDMSRISIIEEKFRMPESQYRQYVAVLATEQGRKIVNDLKNEKTNAIINEYLSMEKEKMRKNLTKEQYLSHKHKGVEIIKSMIAEPLTGNNMLPHRIISITKKEIVNEFIKQGLIKN